MKTQLSQMKCGFILLVLVLLSTTSAENGGDNSKDDIMSDEARLMRDLLLTYSNHKRMTRPVINSNNTILVKFGITLLQILDFDMQNQRLTTLVWKQYVWENELLVWNAEDYGGVNFLVLPFTDIWTPDIILYNNIGKSSVEQHNERLQLYNNGTMVWVPPVKYESSCPVDMNDYPFDTQVCTFKFGSWTYDTSRLDPEPLNNLHGMDTSLYLMSSEWAIVGNTAVRNVVNYSCCEHPYADITFKLVLKRSMTFHIRLIVVPTILLSLMSVTIFCVPPQRPDRTGIGLSLFSSFFLLLIIVVTSSPPSAATRLGQYYIVVILMVTLGILLSVVTINISQVTSPLPRCIEKVFIPMFKWTLLRGTPKFHKKHNKNIRSDSLTKHTLEVKVENEETTAICVPNKPPRDTKADAKNWQTFALILDRIYFICYLLIISGWLCHVFPNPSELSTIL